MKLELSNGKYTLIYEPDPKAYRFVCLRHGEPWRDLVGDNMVYYLVMRIEDLTTEAQLANQLIEALTPKSLTVAELPLVARYNALVGARGDRKELPGDWCGARPLTESEKDEIWPRCESCGGDCTPASMDPKDCACKGCGMRVCQTCADVHDHAGPVGPGKHRGGDPRLYVRKLEEEAARSEKRTQRLIRAVEHYLHNNGTVGDLQGAAVQAAGGLLQDWSPDYRLMEVNLVALRAALDLSNATLRQLQDDVAQVVDTLDGLDVKDEVVRGAIQGCIDGLEKR
jgi:hypothetical protein